jgi:hypothetical protein
MYVQYVYVSTISTGEFSADEKRFHKEMEEGWSTRGRKASKRYSPAAKAKFAAVRTARTPWKLTLNCTQV